MFVGAHYTENTEQTKNNAYEGVGGITFDLGPVSVGYAKAGMAPGSGGVKTAVEWYKNDMYGVAFNINDDLSLSYGKHAFKVSIIAIINGLVLAFIFYLGINFIIPDNKKISFIVSFSLFTVVIISSLMGTLTPVSYTHLTLPTKA